MYPLKHQLVSGIVFSNGTDHWKSYEVGGEIFEPHKFFSLTFALYEFFLGQGMRFLYGYLACMIFFG